VSLLESSKSSSPRRNREKIGKIAIVSHDYNITDSQGRYDYSADFARINGLCDEQGCDTILYALYTWNRDSPAHHPTPQRLYHGFRFGAIDPL